MSHAPRGGTVPRTVQLGHGSGGRLMKRLIDEVFLAEFDAPELHAGDDAGVAPFACTGRIAMSTDSFVVAPAFFPGGNIGRLAVCGTVNDVATSGARVRYLSCGFILEEGFPLDDLRAIANAMMQTAREAGVRIVTGDTKVVERGGADGIYINTAGVGEVPAGVELSGSRCRPGDLVLVSGTLGDHGIAVVSQREGLAFSAPVESDAAPLNRLVADVLAREAEAALAAMRANRYGEHAAIIGEVRKAGTGSTDSAPAGRPLVRVRCGWGATRILDTLVGPQLPRIC